MMCWPLLDWELLRAMYENPCKTTILAQLREMVNLEAISPVIDDPPKIAVVEYLNLHSHCSQIADKSYLTPAPFFATNSKGGKV